MLPLRVVLTFLGAVVLEAETDAPPLFLEAGVVFVGGTGAIFGAAVHGTLFRTRLGVGALCGAIFVLTLCARHVLLPGTTTLVHFQLLLFLEQPAVGPATKKFVRHQHRHQYVGTTWARRKATISKNIM